MGFPSSLPEPDFPDTISTCSLPDSDQDSYLSQPANESPAISDTESSRQSPSPFHLSPLDPCDFPDATRLGDESSLPTLPVASLRDVGESNSPQSTQSLLSDAPSVFEVDEATNVQSPAGEPLLFGEIPDTRHQEPPFMTDGRGRVVWSCSGAKRGSSPLAIRTV